MKSRGAKIGLIVFLSIILVIGLSWYLLDDQRAGLAENYIDQGEKQEKVGNYKQAYLQYKKAEIATPRSFAPYYRQGLLLKKIDQIEKSVKALEKSIEYAREEMAPTFALAKTYFEEKDYWEAEQEFQRCFAFEPDNSDLYFWLGRAQMNQNRLDEAEESFKTALELFPSSQYHLYLGLVLAFEDLPSAQKELERYYQSQSLSLSDFQESSVQGAKSDNDQDLKKAFERMIRTESSATKKLILGQLLNQVGESGLAVQKLAELVKEEPKMRDGWVFLGYGYILENQPEQAINKLNKAKEIDPSHALTFQLLSRAYQAQNNQSAGREALLKARMLENE